MFSGLGFADHVNDLLSGLSRLSRWSWFEKILGTSDFRGFRV